MVRWSYLLPRVVVWVAGLSFLEWGVGPAVRWTVLPMIGYSRNVDLSADQLHVGLLSGTARVDVGTAALAASGKNRTLRVDSIDARLDRRALTHG